MIKILSLSFSVLFTLHLLANDYTLEIPSTIKAVTVYEAGAQVERNAKTTLPAGASVLTFDDLPHYLDINKVQFTGEGDFVIQSIYFTYRSDTLNLSEIKAFKAPEDPAPKIAALQTRDNYLAGKIAIFQAEKTMLEQNSRFSDVNEGTDVERLTEASVFLRERHLDIHNQMHQMQLERREIQEQMNQLRLAVKQAPSPRTERFLELNVRVTAERKNDCEFFITYQVPGASWTPSYDVRVDDVSQPVVLDYKAKVRQSTGEEWENVDLTFSTGKPQNSNAAPELSPWRIGEVIPPPTPVRNHVAAAQPPTGPNAHLMSQPYRSNVKEVSGMVLDQTGQPLPFVNVMLLGTSEGTTTDFDGNYRLAIPAGTQQLEYSFIGFQSIRLNVSQVTMNVYLEEQMMQVAEIMEYSVPLIDKDASAPQRIYMAEASTVGGVAKRQNFKKNKRRDKKALVVDYAAVRASYSPTSVKFTAEVPYTINPDGQEYNVQLTQLDVPAEYLYSCTPKLSNDVYLTARITDWESLDLLVGSAQVYFEGSYVGSTKIDPSFADDTLSMSLGIDPSIRINRQRVKAGSKKQLLGSTRTDSREWNIDVRNAKKSAITLIVEDQIPVSKSEDVAVKLTKADGGELDKDSGFVQWVLKLQAGEEKQINFRYEVQHPKDNYLSLE